MSLVIAASPDVSHGISPPSFAAFPGLQLKPKRPKYHLQGLMLKGVLVQRLVVLSVARHQELSTLGDHLHLRHCSCSTHV